MAPVRTFDNISMSTAVLMIKRIPIQPLALRKVPLRTILILMDEKQKLSSGNQLYFDSGHLWFPRGEGACGRGKRGGRMWGEGEWEARKREKEGGGPHRLQAPPTLVCQLFLVGCGGYIAAPRFPGTQFLGEPRDSDITRGHCERWSANVGLEAVAALGWVEGEGVAPFVLWGEKREGVHACGWTVCVTVAEWWPRWWSWGKQTIR